MTALHSAVVARLGEDFLTEAFGRTYRVSHGVPYSFAHVFTWHDLNDILSRHRLEAPRFRLAAGGTTIPQDAYAAPTATRRNTVWQRLHPNSLSEQLRQGATLVIDAVDELHSGVQLIASQLEEALRAQVQVNLYASWTSKEGFGTHWDDHDVVVVQLDGSKRWKLYGPTRTAPMHRDVAEPEPPPETPVAEFVLTPGDVLYLPRGWWHSVSASEGERSMHLTCGISSMTGADLLIWLSETLRTNECVRADLPRFGTTKEKQAFTDELRAVVLKELENGKLIDRYARHRDATERVRFQTSLPHIADVPANPNVLAWMLTTRHVLSSDESGNAILTANGETFTFAPPVRPLLDRLTDGPHSLADLIRGTDLTPTQVASILTTLMKANVIAVEGENW
ncbi:cupin domain-containing protein [Streptomyces scopuliridis]